MKKMTIEDMCRIARQGVPIDDIDHIAIKVHPSMIETARKAQRKGLVDFVKVDETYEEMRPGLWIKRKKGAEKK